MIPSRGLSGTSMFSKSPGRDIEEKWCLEMLDPYKTCIEALKGWFHSSVTILRSIRNLRRWSLDRVREIGSPVELSQKIHKYSLSSDTIAGSIRKSRNRHGGKIKPWSVLDVLLWWNFNWTSLSSKPIVG